MMDVGDVPIYLRPGYTDGRKAIDGLVGVIQEQMKMDVLQGGLFIFCSKAKTSIDFAGATQPLDRSNPYQQTK